MFQDLNHIVLLEGHHAYIYMRQISLEFAWVFKFSQLYTRELNTKNAKIWAMLSNFMGVIEKKQHK